MLPMNDDIRSRRSIYISDADWAILEAEAARTDDSVAKLVRVAVRAWIDENATINGQTGQMRRTLREMARAYGPPAASFGQSAPAPKPRKRP